MTDKLISDGQIRFRECGKNAQKCPSDRRCCVQMSIGWTVQCLIVHWLDSALSSCPSDGQCSVKLPIGWTVLCPTVHWMASALSNRPLDGQCCVQLSIGWTVLCPIVHGMNKLRLKNNNIAYCWQIKITNFFSKKLWKFLRTSQRTNPIRKKTDNGQCQNFSDPGERNPSLGQPGPGPDPILDNSTGPVLGHKKGVSQGLASLSWVKYKNMSLVELSWVRVWVIS